MAARIPPGQQVTDKWPVLSHGPTPQIDPATWDFQITGEVEEPIRLTLAQFHALPQSTVRADFHCVTTWSRLDNRWSGVLARDLVALVRLRPSARHVLVHCEGGYSTNLTMEQLLDADVIFAHQHDGQALEPDHGWPVRLVVPKLYAWKSAKWVRRIEFTSESQLGLWEVSGYHHRGDPWAEERYS